MLLSPGVAAGVGAKARACGTCASAHSEAPERGHGQCRAAGTREGGGRLWMLTTCTALTSPTLAMSAAAASDAAVFILPYNPPR